MRKGCGNNNDYYPFGMVMPGRDFSSENYRFGFNSKEDDDEVQGDGNWQDYGMRMYNSRLGRLPSIDPLNKKFPFLSTYQFAANKPISNVDYLGGQDEPSLLYYLELYLGIGPKPANAQEIESQAQDRASVQNMVDLAKEADQEIKEAGDYVPFLKAWYDLSHDDLGGSMINVGVDVFAGELLRIGGRMVGKFITTELFRAGGQITYNAVSDVTSYYAKSFKNGEFVMAEATEDFTVFRISGGKATATGGEFFGIIAPKTSKEAEQLYNLKKHGNDATEVTSVTIKKGTQFAVGEIEDGDGIQIVISINAQKGDIVRHLDETVSIAPE
jgi:RHS repeat-associated protein